MTPAVTTVTVRWTGDPAALQRGLRFAMEAITRCTTPDAMLDVADELELTLDEADAAHAVAHGILAAATNDPVLRIEGFEVPDGLGVSVATSGGPS